MDKCRANISKRGSWQERQIYDQDPFSLPQDDARGKKEFYMPLIFYLFAWLVRGRDRGGALSTLLIAF
jgi:hypothetical protein